MRREDDAWFQLGSWTKIREWRKREKERGWKKKMKSCLLCSWYFILGFTDRILDEILNIKNFHQWLCLWSQVEISIHTKKFHKPLQILPMTFHSVGDYVGTRVNNQ